jgi:moderate conductance mechanosensitive channel
MIGLAAVTARQLLDACGRDPSWTCRHVLDATGSGTLAKIAGFVVDDLLEALLIVVAAAIASRLLRRLVKSSVRRVGARRAAVRRHAPSALLDTGETTTLRSSQRVESLAAASSGAVSFIVWIVAVVLVLHSFGVRLGALLAGAGLIGVALGFGAQSLIRDLLAGIFILVEDQFGVGDFVNVGQASGEVEAVTLRATRIRGVDGTVWHMPNGQITAVGNMSQHWSQALLDVRLAYATDVEHARHVIKEAADAAWHADRAIIEEPEVLGVQSMGPAGIVIRLVVKTKPRQQWRVSRELRERIKLRLDEEGVEVPPAAAIAIPETESPAARPVPPPVAPRV